MFGHRGTLIEWSSPVKFQPSNGAANPSGCNRVLLETCGAIRAMLKTFANGLTIPLKNSEQPGRLAAKGPASDGAEINLVNLLDCV